MAETKTKAFKAAFPHTLPIFAGFWFLGIAYGIYMHSEGFSFVYPMVMSLVIFGGSLEFVAVTMLLSPFAPLQTFVMTLLIQSVIFFTESRCFGFLCALVCRVIFGSGSFMLPTMAAILLVLSLLKKPLEKEMN